MNNITIRTNNVPRFTIDAYELTGKERQEFDYLDWKAIDQGNYSATFFRYKGQLYHLDEFMCYEGQDEKMKQWHGVAPSSYFSGTLVKFPDNSMDSVIVGQYFC